VADEKPVFDYTHYSRGEQKAMTRLQLRLQRVLAQANESGDLNDDQFDAKLDELDSMTEELESFVCRFLVSVPRSWLVPEAPENIDWQQPGAFNWLQAHRLPELQEMAVDARRPESVSGN
jgi:hypothetical protein